MPVIDFEILFHQLNGSESSGFPAIASPVHYSPGGIAYLRKPGVALLARPNFNMGGLAGFLEGFDPSLHFTEYLDDLSLLLYGISRSVTHEMVRHRAGFGFSQLSQRYVSGRMLRFVERPEYQDDEDLHSQFLQRIERAASEYASLTNRLLEMQQAGVSILSAEARTDLRKKVQQTARSVLPNETEAPIVVTGNARAWRHVIEMRASPHAETEIRELALRIFLCLRLTDPVLFGDYTIEQLADGTYTVKTEYEKV